MSRGQQVRVAAAVAAVACGAVVFAVAGQGAPSATPTYYQDVKPILDGRCTGCHFSGGIAPFALTSYQQALTHRVALANAVTKRIMPPWHADRGVRTYLHDPSLTDEQIATIRSWVAGRAPAGDAATAAPALPSVAPPRARADVRLPMPQPYTPRRRTDADDYRCFVLPYDASVTRYVTGVNVRPGRPKQVHHIILYLAPPGSAATLERWDAADAGAGYGCYGGPSRTGENLRAPQFVAGWVPGMAGGPLPEGTGVQVPAGSRLILQVHYNLDYVAPRPDRSIVELALADRVERRGLYVPLVNPIWIAAPATFAIPRGARNVLHTVTLDPRPIVSFFAPDVDLSHGADVHAVILHMHRLGMRGELSVVRADGGVEKLLGVPRWDFHWQREYRLAEPVALEPGDRLSIACRHDNTAANQPLIRGRRAKPRHVTWGEDSSDEMCIGFLYVTAR